MQIQKLSQYIFIPPFLLFVFFEYEFAIQKLSSLGHSESFVEIESLLYAVRLPLYVIMFASCLLSMIRFSRKYLLIFLAGVIILIIQSYLILLMSCGFFL